MKLLHVSLFTALLAAAPCTFAQTSGTSSSVTTAPGSARTEQTTRITATVTAINPASRMIGIRRPDGRIVDVKAGPEVKNFDKIKVGDKVVTEYTQALSLALKKGTVGAAKRVESPVAVSSAPRGAQPAGSVAATLTVLADVVAVNPTEQTVTLRGPEGHLVDLRVRDPEQLGRIKQGDQVEAVYTEALAVKVEPAGQ
jgi:hypothetical protein